MAVAHLSFDFRLGGKGGDRVNHDNVYRLRVYECLRDFESLFAVVRLRHDQVFRVHSEASGVSRIEGVFGVDKSSCSAALLGFGDHVERQCGLARRLRAENLDHSAAGENHPLLRHCRWQSIRS